MPGRATTEHRRGWYPSASGDLAATVDGVIAVDPYVVAQFMEYTGPIEVPELDTVVEADAAAEFLLVDQYSLADEKAIRVEALETLGTQAIIRLLGGAAPDPTVLARDLGPLAAENRLAIWHASATSQALLERIGLTAGLPRLGEADAAFGTTVINGSANKIDAFLQRETVVEEIDGRLVATVTLTNGAPTDGFPQYVIGNSAGLPDGSSRLIVQMLGHTFGEITRDGESVDGIGTFTEVGWSGQRFVVELESGESTTLRAEYLLPGTVGSGSTAEREQPITFEQPLRR